MFHFHLSVFQISLGLDVITDGEMDRRDYCSHFCHKLRAVDVNIKRMKTMRNGGETQQFFNALVSLIFPRK